MQLPFSRPSSSSRRNAAIYTGRLLFSTTAFGHTALIISSLATRSPRPLDQNAENVERARTDRKRNKGAVSVSPEQTASPSVEAEVSEHEDLGCSSRVHASATPPRVKAGRPQRLRPSSK